MKFQLIHTNFNVLDLEKSMEFYQNMLGLNEVKRIVPEDGSFIIVYMADEKDLCRLELTWLRDREEPYNLGEKEFHIAFSTDDFEAAYKKHKEAGVICYENTNMGIYFIEDPDGYWVEVLPAK
ncbi:MAG: VOC family protein [Eubacteriales bacterium]|nr:VOC family protein [Eubacteriales bacterium]